MYYENRGTLKKGSSILFRIMNYSSSESLSCSATSSSGTSSNILFTALQYNVADVLGISAPIVLSEQSAAAALSNSFSPGNAALGTGVSNQAGREGEILAATGVYNILQGLLVGILAFILISMGLGL